MQRILPDAPSILPLDFDNMASCPYDGVCNLIVALSASAGFGINSKILKSAASSWLFLTFPNLNQTLPTDDVIRDWRTGKFYPRTKVDQQCAPRPANPLSALGAIYIGTRES